MSRGMREGRRSGEAESVSIWQDEALHNAPSVPPHARKCVSASTHVPRHQSDGSSEPRRENTHKCVCAPNMWLIALLESQS